MHYFFFGVFGRALSCLRSWQRAFFEPSTLSVNLVSFVLLACVPFKRFVVSTFLGDIYDL